MEILGEKLGIIRGRTKISNFSFAAQDMQKISHGQYVVAKDKNTGEFVLAQIIDITATGSILEARCTVLGKVVNEKLVSLSRPVPAGSEVFMPTSEFLEMIISSGLPDKRILIGRILTHPEFVPVHFNPADLSRHMLVVATTGGGKSYTLGVMIEEILEFVKKESEDYAVIIFDVHNEYGGLLLPNEDPKQIEELKKYGYEPKGYDDQILIFDWELNPPRMSDEFSPDRLMFLYQMKDMKYGFMLKDLLKDLERADLDKLIELIELSDLHRESKRALLTRIRALRSSNLVGKDYIDISKIIKPGYAIIFRLASTPMGELGLRFFVADVLRTLYTLYKRRKVLTKTIIILDEAHLFAPRKGNDAVKEIIERIAREGRKYGLWLVLATQGTRDLSDAILKNVNTLLALKMQKEDINELSRLFGVPKGVAEALTRARPGRGYLRAPSLTLPIMIAVRPKRSLDVKNERRIIEKMENAVKQNALKTLQLIKPKREPPKEEHEEEIKRPEEVSKRIEEFAKTAETAMVSEQEEKEQALKPQKFEVRVPEYIEEPKPRVIDLSGELKVKPPIKKTKKEVKRTVIIDRNKLIMWIAEDLKRLGFASKELLKELVENEVLSLPDILARYDDLIAIMPLRSIGIAEEMFNQLKLTASRYLYKRFGLRISEYDARELLLEAVDYL